MKFNNIEETKAPPNLAKYVRGITYTVMLGLVGYTILVKEIWANLDQINKHFIISFSYWSFVICLAVTLFIISMVLLYAMWKQGWGQILKVIR